MNTKNYTLYIDVLVSSDMNGYQIILKITTKTKVKIKNYMQNPQNHQKNQTHK